MLKPNFSKKIRIDVLAVMIGMLGKKFVEAETMLGGWKKVWRKIYKASRRSLNFIGSSSLRLGIGGAIGEFYRALSRVLRTNHCGVDSERIVKKQRNKDDGYVFQGRKGGKISEEK